MKAKHPKKNDTYLQGDLRGISQALSVKGRANFAAKVFSSARDPNKNDRLKHLQTLLRREMREWIALTGMWNSSLKSTFWLQHIEGPRIDCAKIGSSINTRLFVGRN